MPSSPDPAGPEWLPAAPEDQGSTPAPGTKTPPATGRWRRAATIGLIAVLVVAAAVWVGDWVARATAMDRLVEGIEQSEAAMVAAMAGVSATVAGERTNPDQLPQESAERLVGFAEQGLGDVSAAAVRIEAVAVQPWHGEVEAARTAYLAHNEAWQAYLAAAAEDPAAWFSADPAIESTWRDLRPVLLAAVPVPSAFDLADRVDAVLDDGDGEPDDSSTLQAAGGRTSH